MIPLPFTPGPSALIPSWHTLSGVPGFAVALMMCLGLGALAIGRNSEPEIQIAGGWGLLSLVLTLWGVASSASLRIPLAILTVLAAGVFFLPRLRGRIASGRGALVVLALSLPLWLVMLPAAPSQVDSWLNLLPNAAYLVDHGRFPAHGAAPSFSFLPGAPYDTQFIAFATSVFSGSFAESAMGWFNIALACLAGMMIARLLPGWGEARRRPLAAFASAAAGLLLAVPLNPGFVPRFCFSPYGEWPLAASTMFAGWLGARLIEEGRNGISARATALSLALVLVAEVNTKQSGLGLVLALGIPLCALGVWRLRGWRRLSAAAPVVPALLLYAIWQAYVLRSGATELQVEPLSAWNTGLLPTTFLSMAHEAIEHPGLFICMAAVLAGGARSLWLGRRDFTAMLLCLSAGTSLLFNAYIVASYVVHSDPLGAEQAHSFFRYNTQLSLLLILTLVVWLRPRLASLWIRLSEPAQRRAQAATVGLALVAPLASWPWLRFDLDAPQPTLAALARDVSARLGAGDRVALILPGDRDDALGGFLRGQILFLPPRRKVAAFASYDRLDPGVIRSIEASGFDKILRTCAPLVGQGTAIPGAALLGREGGSWRRLAAWQYPPALARAHFASLIPRRALCEGP